VLCWSVRALCALCSASRQHDQYGWASLREPLVADVVGRLLVLQLALRAWEASVPDEPDRLVAARVSLSRPTDAVADILRVALATLERTLGREVMEEAKKRSCADAAAAAAVAGSGNQPGQPQLPSMGGSDVPRVPRGPR